MGDYYRRDGTPYPPGTEGLLAWAFDFETLNRRVDKTILSDGKIVSTMWIGLDMGHGGPPLIFETMVFHEHQTPFEFAGRVRLIREELDCRRYSTEEEAQAGHLQVVEKWEPKKDAKTE